jgi:hypothetical protein
MTLRLADGLKLPAITAKLETRGSFASTIEFYSRYREGTTAMDIPAATKELLEAKRGKGLTFAELGKLLGRDEVWVPAATL